MYEYVKVVSIKFSIIDTRSSARQNEFIRRKLSCDCGSQVLYIHLIVVAITYEAKRTKEAGPSHVQLLNFFGKRLYYIRVRQLLCSMYIIFKALVAFVGSNTIVFMLVCN
jgi:hypothetical protein